MKEKIYSGNQSFLRELNLISSLHLIRSKGLISRAELADTLGLNRSTLTAIAGRLIEERLVKEVGTGHSSGGRPPTLLQFNAEAAYALCVDWSSERVNMHVCDLSGNAVFSGTLRHDPTRSAARQIADVAAALKRALAGLPAMPHGLLGMAVGVPGIIDREAEAVSSYALGWDQVPLALDFREAFGCPVVVENIANVGLTAERHFGCAVGEENVIYLRLDRGIVAGHLYKNQIYRGDRGFVGNVGHVVIEARGKPCNCGSRGCWTNYASEQALLESYEKLAGSDSITLGEFLRLVRAGDAAAAAALHEFAEYLGIGIANLVNTLNPGVVVIDGAVNGVSDRFEAVMRDAIDRAALPYPKRSVKVLFSSLGERSVVLGGTALVFNRVFATPNVLPG